jgi:hypothetical protein
LEAVLNHAVNGGLPFSGIGQVKDKQVILSGCASGGVSVLDSELEVVRRVRMTEHDAIEAFVIIKGGDDFKAESITIKVQDVGHMVGGTGNAQMGVHGSLQVRDMVVGREHPIKILLTLIAS